MSDCQTFAINASRNCLNFLERQRLLSRFICTYGKEIIKTIPTSAGEIMYSFKHGTVV